MSNFTLVLDFSNAIEAADMSTAPTIITKREDAFTQVITEPQSPPSSEATVVAATTPITTPATLEPTLVETEDKIPWVIIGGGVALVSIIGAGGYFVFSEPEKVVTIKNVNHTQPPVAVATVVAPPKPNKPPEVISIPPRDLPPIIKEKTPASSEPIVVASVQTVAIAKPQEQPEKPVKKPPEIKKPEVLSSEQTIVVNSLLDNCILRASTVVKEHIRILKNESIIKDIKSLKMDTGRTKFITDTLRQVQTSQERVDNNITQYYKNLTKLKLYKINLVSEQLLKIEEEGATRKINQGVLGILTEHLTKLAKEQLTLEESKKDLESYARTISSTL